jgi:hypothetical protein
MRSALVILRKDLQRFWWEITATLVPLAILSWLDAQRYDFVPGPMEALLSIFLPIAWAYLVAVVIQEDGIVGGRQFWMVRPISAGSLVLAKAMFIVIAIHVPDFIADCVVVAGHGHPLVESLLPLFWKQAVLAAVVTIPAAALASVTDNLAQFFPAALVFGVGAYLLAASKLHDRLPWDPPDTRGRFTGLVILLFAAAVVLAIQYRLRRAGLARLAGGLAILSGGILFANMQSREDLALADALKCDTPSTSIFLERTAGTSISTESRGTPATMVVLPVIAKGLPQAQEISSIQRTLRLQTASGETWNSAQKVEPRDFRKPDLFHGNLSVYGDEGGAQFLYLGSEVVRRLRDSPFSLQGMAVFRFYAQKDQPLGIGDGLKDVAEVGRCSTQRAEWRGPDELLKVYCESPRPIPNGLLVILTTPGRAWRAFFGNSMPDLSYPWQTWLSPLSRRQTFFHLDDGPGDNWRPPREAAKNIAIRLNKRMGCSVVSYQLRDLRIDH